ncbi:DUF1189 domain-containing protein [Salibacterium aidingense]|uniref:DUF1189 domain-containing protein n=1 Tax=Salibacterium aidingense TaxID=384933 RepID=UPI00042552F8|nr:DUF1189 domain-containing protein [Salibacterium aidingense]
MNTIQTFIKCLHSPTYIGRFRFKSIGKTIGYVFLLMFLASIPAGVFLTNTVFSGVSQLESALSHEELPQFSISNGRLSSEMDEPFRKMEDAQGNIIIFDPSGRTTADELELGENVTAFLEERFVLEMNGDRQTFRYEQAGNFHIEKEDLLSYMESVDGLLLLFIPVILVCMYLLTTALKFIGIFSLSVFGLLIRKASPIPLSYRQIWIICAYTVTLPTLIMTIFNAFPFQLPYSFTVYWLIAFVWLYVVFKIPRKSR